jgi:hypothetical protein
MAYSQVVSNISGAGTGLVSSSVAAPVETVYAPPGGTGYTQWLEQGTMGAGAGQRNFRRWTGLPGAGASRATIEDFGYDATVVAPGNIKRYAQYKPVAAMTNTVGSQDAGEICLNFGLLDPRRSQYLGNPADFPAVPATQIAFSGNAAVVVPNNGAGAAGAATINSTSQVWFFLAGATGAASAAGITPPQLVAGAAGIQPGTGFTLTAPIPAGQLWRYVIVAGPPVV